MSAIEALSQAISRYGLKARAKLDNPAVAGEPEEQLRQPLHDLVKEMAGLVGLAGHEAELVGETRLSDLMTRPDFAVTRRNALIGYIEIKSPDKGADPTKYSAKSHDREQWERLKALPNLIYSNGNSFRLWQDGKWADPVVHLVGDVRTSGAELRAPPELLRLFELFFQWAPIQPRTPRQLAETSARLCRLLRDEVIEHLGRGAQSLTELKEDWRRLLFPHATDEEFADGYAQAVTFGLLMARARGISLESGIEPAARALRRSNSLIGSALWLLTEEATEAHTLDTSLQALRRVLEAVDWSRISRGEPEAWLYFYELFLQQYDPKLRKKTGSYYTPPEIVNAMVRLVDDALRSRERFGLADGLASSEVTVADPAVGTGTFLLGILRRIAGAVASDQGEGAVPAVVSASLRRLIGFELQFGPFAVAQLRMLAEIAELTGVEADAAEASDLRLYIADTLADPDEETAWIPHNLASIAESRRAANAVKRREPITVVIGNPPYKEKAKGLGEWVESRGPGLRAPLDDWQPPTAWRVGAHARHLRNLYVYFWRWATWKVFGGDPYRGGVDTTEAVWTRRRGVVCFITVAGFLNGPGFQKMRDDLRRQADEIWVIDCSPEGHQPPVSTRVFQGVQQPVCIVMASRLNAADPDRPARVRFRSLPEGPREVKFAAIAGIGLDDADWLDAPTDWRAPFLPAGAAEWDGYPALEDLFDYNGTGVMVGRTWVIAPDSETLRKRWARLVSEPDAERKAMLFHPHLRDGKPGDKHVDKVVKEGLAGHAHRALAVAKDAGAVIEPAPCGFRSFDRQWIIPDARLLNQANPTLWDAFSEGQIYFTAPHDRTPTAGPSLTVTALIPDVHHYHGRGGRVFPLWADASATVSNVSSALLSELSAAYGRPVTPEDLFAYIAAVAAGPAYLDVFGAHLKQPGLRIPITADRDLFARAVELGREVVWLHTFGERFNEGRPPGPPRVDRDEPTIPAGAALPTTLDAMPHELDHDAAERRLKIGTGYIANVSPEVWAYEVSGKNVLKQWWSYRRKDRSKPPMGDRRPPSPLSEIIPETWPPEYTAELLNVLRVLTRLVALEPQQAELLRAILAAPLIDADALRESGALSNHSAEAGSQELQEDT